MVASTAPRHARDLLQVHEWGDRTTVSFVRDVSSLTDNGASLLTELRQILWETHCRHLVFDLTDFELSSSGMLALFLWPVRSGVKVTLCNPSSHLCDILQRTQLDSVVRVVRLTRPGLN